MPWFVKLVGIICYVIFASGGAVYFAAISGLGVFSWLVAALPIAVPALLARRRIREQEQHKALPRDGWFYYDPNEKYKP